MHLEIQDKDRNVGGKSVASGYGCALVHKTGYNEGDQIVIHVPQGGLYRIQLDETLGSHIVYLKEEARYAIPCQPAQRTCYPAQAFSGGMHLLTLSKVGQPGRRNLALNPYDHHRTSGLFPHAKANVETRGEMVFAARNAIDGNFTNHSHGEYPFASWGINRDPKAELTLDFGRPVLIDEIRLTIRADWPHDSWWTEAKATDNEGRTHVFQLQKHPLPQRFPIKPAVVTSLTLHDLKKEASDPSPFPALTQLEVWGVEA